MKKNEVSIITINYNSSKYTIELIESIKKYSTLVYEIIIVDNASEVSDFKALQEYIQKDDLNIRLIENRINSGFASANMLGVNYANADYYFFINNDAKLLNNVTLMMKDYLDSNLDVALITAKINDEDGNFSSSYKLFPSLVKEMFGNTVARKFNGFPSNKIKLNKTTFVEVVSGSCMFFRAEIFNSIGGFDTAFFLYCEEEDISKRVWNSAYKVVFLPDAEILHHSGGSTKRSLIIEREYYISYQHLIRKHYNQATVLGLNILLFIKLFRRVFKNKNGYKLFLFFLSNGFSIKNSMKYTQKLKS